MNVAIRTAKPADAGQVAALHVTGIPTGFISSLGIEAVRGLYERILTDKTSLCLVAEQDGQIVGFVAFSANLQQLYRTVILSGGWKLVVRTAKLGFSPRRIKKILQTLLYPRRTQRMDLPAAELLAIVVSPECRGRGLAAELVRQGLTNFAEYHVDCVKVMVAQANTAANSLYLACGFELAQTYDSHGVPSNIYVRKTRTG
jgi:ribosomal protein S18 acetylase RimI-like enzyme